MAEQCVMLIAVAEQPKNLYYSIARVRAAACLCTDSYCMQTDERLLPYTDSRQLGKKQLSLNGQNVFT